MNIRTEGPIKKAIVLGGGNDQISLIQELRRRFPDVFIVLIDYFDAPPAKNFADKHIVESTLNIEAVHRIAQNERADLVITACTDQALLTMAYVSEKMELRCYLTYEQALNFTNKLHMKKLMIESGIPTSNFRIFEQGEEPETGDLRFPLIIKPVDNNSSKGVTTVTGPDRLKDALRKAFASSRSGRVIVEEFKAGDEYSVDALLLDGRPEPILFSKKRKLPVINNALTMVQSSYHTALPAETEREIRSIIAKIGVVFGVVNTPIFMQFLFDGRNVHVIEFSARTGGGSWHHFIKAATGVDLIASLLDITFGRTPDPRRSDNNRCALMNYVYTKPGIFANIQNFEELKAQRIIDGYYLYKPFGARISHIQSSSDRVAGFFVTAPAEEELGRKIHSIDSTVKVLDENGADIMMHGLYSLIEKERDGTA